ncbi:MAG: methionine adenosyltransferase [Dehalococcoidia bacterium]|nr:methionine adenosyltransferase [Dehalococcoidia bacterium]
MATTFEQSQSYLYTSESVTEGHPDKICDQISDAILDAIFSEDPNARVACETATTTNLIMVFGEITTTANIDYEAIVRLKVQEIGYDDPDIGIDYKSCRVLVEIHQQSPDISQAVSTSLEHRDSDLKGSEIDTLGAGDQGMMVGFACDETKEFMPLTLSLSHALTQRLSIIRKEGVIPYLKPDGKSQVTVEYEFGKPKRIHTVIVSTQHSAGISLTDIEQDIINNVINPVLPPELVDKDTKIFVNPSGSFVVGGPHGDAGLTGRKILVDTYGGVARHGGGAFSGKDPTKVDRSAAYAARYVAKNILAAGLASRCEVQVSYAIGVSAPINVSVETFGTGKITDEKISQLVNQNFDLRPGAIIQHLGLRKPIYSATASYGHFGRPDIQFPWERTDMAELLQLEAAKM